MAQPLPRYLPEDLEQWQAKLTAITSHTEEVEIPAARGGDRERRRGIPIIGAGPGAIPGTTPHQPPREQRRRSRHD